MPTFTGFPTCYGRQIWQKVNGQQRKHFGGLHSAVSLWLKVLCSYFYFPHKHWRHFSHIMASHCWVVESGAVSTMTGKRLGRPFTDTLDCVSPIWFKAPYIAHFLHNEQQMLTKAISLPDSKPSVCSFIIASFLCRQILAQGCLQEYILHPRAAVATVLTLSHLSFTVLFWLSGPPCCRKYI